MTTYTEMTAKVSKLSTKQIVAKMVSTTRIDEAQFVAVDRNFLKTLAVNWLSGIYTLAEVQSEVNDYNAVLNCTDEELNVMFEDVPLPSSADDVLAAFDQGVIAEMDNRFMSYDAAGQQAADDEEAALALEAEAEEMHSEDPIYNGVPAAPATPLDSIRSSVTATSIEHHDVQFPLTHQYAGVYSFAGCDREFYFSEGGLGYLCYRLAPHADFNVLVSLLRRNTESAHDDIARLVNEARTAQIASDAKVGRRTHFVMTVLSNNSTLQGFLTTYKTVPHTLVLDAIDAAGLAHNVISGFVSPHVMNVYIRSQYTAPTGMAVFGIRVQNGETGHKALSYNAFFSISGYEYFFPARAFSRHLGKVDQVANDLRTVFDEAVAVEVFEYVKRMSFTQALLAVGSELDGEEYDKVEAAIKVGQSGMDLVDQLSALRSVRGFKGLATRALDAVMTAAFFSL